MNISILIGWMTVGRVGGAGAGPELPCPRAHCSPVRHDEVENEEVVLLLLFLLFLLSFVLFCVSVCLLVLFPLLFCFLFCFFFVSFPFLSSLSFFCLFRFLFFVFCFLFCFCFSLVLENYNFSSPWFTREDLLIVGGSTYASIVNPASPTVPSPIHTPSLAHWQHQSNRHLRMGAWVHRHGHGKITEAAVYGHEEGYRETLW